MAGLVEGWWFEEGGGGLDGRMGEGGGAGWRFRGCWMEGGWVGWMEGKEGWMEGGAGWRGCCMEGW